ncbi:MAG: formate dehydrogenase accessory protein FdhE [Acidobacteria bacterium]|nr:formate dehydrogenase accessory protein FdhE [Acidobacteriota bacterium]
MTRTSPGERQVPRDIHELRSLATRQPDLAAAATLHAELVAIVRRVESRISSPSLDIPIDLLQARMARGVPLASFGEFPVDWSDVRLLVRQVTDVFRRMNLVDAAGAARLHAAGREVDLSDRARRWYERAADAPEDPTDPDGMWGEVLIWAMRPFLVRTADVLSRRVSFDGWRRGHCPVCAAEPEFGCLTAAGDQFLLCGRCHARWPFDAPCPFCTAATATDITVMTTADRVYRVNRCGKCERYLKVLDGPAAGRPLLPYYDPVATLPLDAAMIQAR